jgi:hypothetical protein
MNSASVNCQPSSSHVMIPSSITRFVDANPNAIAAVKLAPFRKSERASATAAYEQDDEAAPRPHAIAIERKESSGRRRVTDSFETTACTTAESPNPSTSAHRISQVMPNAKLSASAIDVVIAAAVKSRPAAVVIGRRSSGP